MIKSNFRFSAHIELDLDLLATLCLAPDGALWWINQKKEKQAAKEDYLPGPAMTIFAMSAG